MQESQDNKKVNEEINKLFAQATVLEQVSFAIKSMEGQKIIDRIGKWLQVKQVALNNLALKELSINDHYEYSKDDLQRMKIVRAQLSAIKELIGQLNPEVLEKQVNTLRKKAFELSENPEELLSKLVY